MLPCCTVTMSSWSRSTVTTVNAAVPGGQVYSSVDDARVRVLCVYKQGFQNARVVDTTASEGGIVSTGLPARFILSSAR